MQSFEIELRGIVKDDHELAELEKTFSNRGALVRDETVHTEKYFSRDIDVRLRRTEDKWEVVWKHNTATDAIREERTENNLTAEDAERFRKQFLTEGLTLAPLWTTHRRDYAFIDENEPFEASLQQIPGFSRLIEIEYKGTSADQAAVVEHVKQIFRSIGIEPVNPKQFLAQISAYKQA